MSQHHRKSKHTTKAPKVRKQIEALLPMRCTNCRHPVTSDMRWQVGHRLDAMHGGETTIENCGPAHSWCPWCRKACNQVAGGRLGAAVTNGRRSTPASPRRATGSDVLPW